jgi:NAD(P)-dependent dehydrogenase (short-subunit alcohol dehydrogenase family)
MLIEKSSVKRNSLSGKTVLLTGGGGGIGYEAARALIWLGAKVIIAEIDSNKGKTAELSINKELNTNNAYFYRIDITDEKQINSLYTFVKDKFEFLDVIINNATVTPMGSVDKVLISDWDKSYAVNIKAPVMLIQKFLPDMKEKNTGTIVFVPSSGAAPYMGAYEIFKTAGVELCNTLAGELENTGIFVYSIGPGLVKTETAQKAIEKVASFMNMSIPDFYEMNEKHILDAESAGTGFAVSVVNASKYNGQEIASIQALIDAGILKQDNNEKEKTSTLSEADRNNLKTHILNTVNIYNEQYKGWLERNIFERQWVLRDFKKTVTIPADQFLKELEYIKTDAEKDNYIFIDEKKLLFIKLQEYYRHQYKLLQGYEKNPEKLKENSGILNGWIDELQIIIDILK